MESYAGLWIAQTEYNGQIVGTGLTGVEALRLARRNFPRRPLQIRYIPDQSGRPLTLSPLLETFAPFFAQLDLPIYLVGGAVRDAILGVQSNDLDFVVPHSGIKIAFALGDYLKAPAYPLDKSRDVGRVVLKAEKTYLDIATYRGKSLEADLYDRDFRLNAMAIPALARTTAELIDPTGGLSDMENEVICAVTPSSIHNDPLRMLRGVRMALKFHFTIDAETGAQMKEALPALARVSNERVRDEVVNLFRLAPAAGLDMLNRLGLLNGIFPEIKRLEGVTQSSPHFEPVFEHTLRVVHYLEEPEHLYEPLLSLADRPALTRLSSVLEKHLARPVAGGLTGRDLLLFAGLFHDVGKAQTRSVEQIEQNNHNNNNEDEHGERIRFLGHAEVGAGITEGCLKELRMSSEGIKEVKLMVEGHMRPLLYANQSQIEKKELSTKALHRFWRKFGQTGLDISLLALADFAATYHNRTVEEKGRSTAQLHTTVATLLAHYLQFEAPDAKKPPILTGDELMQGLNLPAGPEIGRLLRLLAEAQVSGEVSTKEEALLYLRNAMQ